MSILRRFLTKYSQFFGRRQAKTIRRRQFNMTIDAGLILGVKLLATILEVPRYVITEHLLQVGTYYVYQALQDEQKRQQLQEHLVKVHLLGSELQDGEDILRL
jgi:hypothetical protein